MRQWAKEWLEVYKKPKTGDKQYKRYKSNLENHILPIIGNMKLKEVKPTNLQKILNKHEGESFSQVSKIKIAICAMFKQAKKERLIRDDPAEDLFMPETTEGTHRSITDEERSIILKVAETHYAGLWIMTMLHCGPRPQETFPLTWRDIDFKKAQLSISKAKEGGSNKIKGTKSAAGTRVIPIPAPLLERFEKEYNKIEDKRDIENRLIFMTSGGKMLCDQRANFWWKNFKRHMNIAMGATLYRSQIVESKVAADLVPYCLRHSYCTDLQRAGVPINVAKYLMGHSDIALTANIYSHHTEDTTNDAKEKLEALYLKDNVENIVENN